ncbi:MAG: hypothetical protein LBR57_02115 [Alistipes sp.]|jgi:hypothetical protein|nr:hypothetical protein [Alistipes sp.]
MKFRAQIPGAVLPTVMVVAVLFVLLVVGLISLWEADFLYFLRHRHETMMRAHIESGFTLYAEYPDETMGALGADSTLLLYDSLPGSRIEITRKPHGLYEIVTIAAGRTRASKIFGSYPADLVLCYPDRGSSVTLAGKTNLKGRMKIPGLGVIYGQMGADFFRGEEISRAMMTASEKELPKPTSEALAIVEQLKTLAADDVTIDASWSSPDTVVVARKAHIEQGFKGSLQVFALDSIIVAEDVTLEYPSGLFSETHVTVSGRSTVNGYIIVAPADSDNEPDIMHANYKQSRNATVRGLLYVDGIAQLQGIVSGVVIVDRAIYYSPRGYYENMLYDVTILENHEMAWPLWLSGAPTRRREAKWLN